MSNESFKFFVRKHPELIDYVNSNQMTWQKFYDMYTLYGEDENTWNKYFKKNSIKNNTNEILNYIKNIDKDTLQKGISGIEKALSFIKDLGSSSNTPPDYTSNYSPRPLYRSFDD